MAHELSIGFVGNPNCGKTTLFNAYTGANLKVANWPGVTVEKKEGVFQFHDHEYKLVDLPGTYSLTSYTMEEQVTRQYILSDDVDVIIDVADASALERNLYLTLQLIELGKPVILALNMMDIVQKRGMEIDLHRLPEMLGIPVIPVSARRKTGLDILMHAAAHHKDSKSTEATSHHHHRASQTRHRHDHHGEYVMVYSDEIEDKIDLLMDALRQKYPGLENLRWYALKLLENDTEITRDYPVNLPQVLDRSYEQEIINQKYDFIDEVIGEVLVNKSKKEALTDKVDSLLTHRVLGLPIFLCIMALVFFLTFTVGDWLKGYFQVGLDAISSGVAYGLDFLHVAPLLTSLIVDGIMGKLGLSGRAFIPMILGFGCTVPAIMASRALENKRDRYKTMLITPFMSCSARLPIYVLFSELFFPQNALLAAYSMYLLGIVVAILCAFILHLIDRKKERENALLIELPEYKAPSARTIAIYVWEKVKDYLTKAGTTIFVASIIMWVLLNFGPSGYSQDISSSFGSIIGRFIVPFFAPIGLGFWQIVVALIAGISAKEVVVSSTAVLFGVASITSPEGMASLMSSLTAIGFGPLNAYCLMVFCLLYVPCAATLATIKKETGSWGRVGLSAAFQIAVAWVITFLVYHIGLLLV